jgi:PKD repeat protein
VRVFTPFITEKRIPLLALSFRVWLNLLNIHVRIYFRVFQIVMLRHKKCRCSNSGMSKVNSKVQDESKQRCEYFIESSIHKPYLNMKRVSSCVHIMRGSSRLLASLGMTIALTAAIVAIAIILLTPNITITNAQQLQQQQQPPINQPVVTQNGTTLFQNTEDGVRLEVPQGWVIHDVNNTGSTRSEEATQGYGILAQLCPQEEQEQQATLSNASRSDDTANCQGSEGDIIHIVRYPDLDTRLQVPNNITTNNNNNVTSDNILLYHMQKLEEVGYNRIEVVDSTDSALNLTNAQTNQTIATVPAKNVEMTYNTNFAPNETRTGYFILTATNATAPNVGTTKGYSVFYEGNSAATSGTITPSGSLASTSLPAPVRRVFDSFELVTVVPTEPLTVEITPADTEGGGDTAPATFEFEADVAGGTEPYTYSWDFDGDGTEDSTEPSVSHTFEEAGSYDVGLTVTDSGGQSASDSMEITVEEAPAAEEVVVEEEEEILPEEVEVEEEEEEILPEEVEVEEEEEEILPEEVEVEEEVGEDIEDIRDDVDAFVDDILDRFGVDN